MSDQLKEEQTFFDGIRKELLAQHPGQYALIKGAALIETFDTSDEANAVGVGRFGQESFLVKKIDEPDPVIVLPVLNKGLLETASLWFSTLRRPERKP